MNNINISKDLEKSIVPDSIVITDANNKPKYLPPPNYPEMYLGKDVDGTIKYKSITFPQAQVNNDLGYFGSTIQQGFPLVKDTSTNLSGFRRDFFGDGIFSIGLNQNTPQFGLYDGLFYSPLLRYYSNRFNIGNFGTTVGSAQQHEIWVSNQGVDNTTIPELSNNYSINLMSRNTMGASNIMNATHRLFGVDNNYYGGGVGTGAKSSISNVQTALFRHTINTGANIDFGTVHNIRSQLYRRTGGSTINTFYHINTEDVDTAVPITNYFGLHILAGDKNYIKNNLGINTTTPVRKLEITETAGTPPIRTTNMTSASTDITGTVKAVVVDANGDFGVKAITSSNEDFWRNNSDGITKPDGITDFTDVIRHNSDIYVGGAGSGAVRVGNGSGNIGSNTIIGEGALNANTIGNFNTAIGYNSLNTNTSGSSNTAIGYLSLNKNNTGAYNLGIGNSALNNNTTGSANTAIGYQALIFNTTGANNTAIGNNSLNSNTTGYTNISVGNTALYQNTVGANNVAVGFASLNNNTTGSTNTGIGSNSLFKNTIGNFNVAVGNSALSNNTSGGNNTAIGINSGYDFNASQSVTALIIGQSYIINILGTTDFTLIGAASNTVGVIFTATGVGTGTGYAIPNINVNNNTVVGYNSGRGIVYGSNNTILGANVTGLSSTLAGYIILADGLGNKRIVSDNTGKIGINTFTPARKLEINEVAGTSPIRTTNMTSSSTNMTGVLKNVVVNASGDFGVSDVVINSYNIRSTATVTTITNTDYTIVFTATGLTQPLPTSVNKQIINLKNNSTGVLTISGNIDGAVTTITVSSKSSLTFHGDGTTWFII